MLILFDIKSFCIPKSSIIAPNFLVACLLLIALCFLVCTHRKGLFEGFLSNCHFAAALERQLWSTASVNEEVLGTIHVIFSNFHKLHISEAATLCIPHLVAALKSGSESAQDSILTILCLLKHSWSTMPIDVSKSQAMVAAEAIPILQMLMKTCPPSFHERLESLLNCLPGCLTVTIKRANNLKHTTGGTNPYCRLTIGNGPSRQTKVLN